MPAVAGAVKVIPTPVALVLELKEPPLGLMLQVTPEASLVVADSPRVWVTVKPARFRFIVTEIVEAEMVRFSDFVAVFFGVAESWTMNPRATFAADTVGVPEMTPVALAKVRPVGSAPLVMLQV